jgi:dTDP-4-amino-4,6-dideoxygalactose transaminase
VASRGAVAAQLCGAGIGIGVHYEPALHWQPALRGHVVAPYRLPNAEAWAAEELSLPMSPALRSDEIERAADACLEAVVRSSALEGAHV